MSRAAGCTGCCWSPFLGVLFPWIYNTESPELFGIPFFWWYQMAWVPVSAVLTIVVYRGTTKRER